MRKNIKYRKQRKDQNHACMPDRFHVTLREAKCVTPEQPDQMQKYGQSLGTLNLLGNDWEEAFPLSLLNAASKLHLHIFRIHSPPHPLNQLEGNCHVSIPQIRVKSNKYCSYFSCSVSIVEMLTDQFPLCDRPR